MCSSSVLPEAQPLLAELLRDMAEAIAPGEGHLVVIGPVDFGVPPTKEAQ